MIGMSISNEPGAVVWNEQLSRDPDRAREFYGAVFGLTFAQMEGEAYWTFTPPGVPESVGGLGALTGRGAGRRPRPLDDVLLVESVDDTVATAEGAGGTVAQPGFDTSFGRMAVLVDPDAARCSRSCRRRRRPPRRADRAAARRRGGARASMADVTTSPFAHAAQAVPTSPRPATRAGEPSGLGEQPLGPLDGRYRAYVAPLAQHLSEAALNRERLHVEVAWLVHLADEPRRPRPAAAHRGGDRAPARGSSTASTPRPWRSSPRSSASPCTTSRRSSTTSSGALEGTSLADVAEYVHVFSTSEDVNNLAYALMVRGAVREVWLPAATGADRGPRRAWPRRCADQPMLARTHGQAATPTTLGKELAVLAHRLRRQLRRIDGAEYLGKANGATGTYAAHVVARAGHRLDRRLPRLRRGPRPDLEPADHADRVARLAGRALRRRRALQPDPAQPLHRRLDLHLARLLRPGRRSGGPGHGRLQHHAAQGQPDPVRERRGEPRGELRAVRPARLDPRDVTGCSATSPTRPPSGTSAPPSGTRSSRSRTSGGASRAWTPTPARWRATSTTTGRCSARRCSPSCGCTAWSSRTSGSRSSPAAAASTPARCARSSRPSDLPDDARDRLLALTPATYTGLAPELVRRYGGDRS